MVCGPQGHGETAVFVHLRRLPRRTRHPRHVITGHIRTRLFEWRTKIVRPGLSGKVVVIAMSVWRRIKDRWVLPMVAYGTDQPLFIEMTDRVICDQQQTATEQRAAITAPVNGAQLAALSLQMTTTALFGVQALQ